MKSRILNFGLAAVAIVAAMVAPQTVFAQSAPGIAVASLDQAVAKSNAAVQAASQINTTHKAALDSAQARANALNTEINGLVQAYQTAAKAPNANQAALQQQAATIEKKRKDGQAEVQNMTRVPDLARAYAVSQIQAKLDAAVRSAMTKKRVTMLAKPEAMILALPASDITSDIVAELNVLVPSVSTTPPTGWPNQQPAAAAAAPKK